MIDKINHGVYVGAGITKDAFLGLGSMATGMMGNMFGTNYNVE